MATLATTRMSSKGQVVIPEQVRDQLGLRSGTRFIVLAKGDAVILKAIVPPSPDEFDRLMAMARRAARQAGLKPADVKTALARVRSARRAKRGDR